MMFVAGEIFVWMLLSFVLGIGIGWAARSRRAGGAGTRTGRRRFR